MIDIFFNKNSSLVEIRFNGSTFFDVLEYCKEENLTFVPSAKVWTCEPRKFLDRNLLKGFKELDLIDITPVTKELIRKATLPKEFLINSRMRYNPNIVNFKPLRGKKGHENYQLDDIKKCLKKSRYGIFWEQRLGKAVWMSVHISHLFYYKKVDKAIILTPSSGVYNLRKEILKFSKLFKLEDIDIASKDNREPFNNPNTKIIICTYRTFLLMSDHYYKLNNPKGTSKAYRKTTLPLKDWGNERVIYADESQELGNPTSRQSKVAHIHKKFFKYRYILTGTPGDKIPKYYSQLRFLDDSLIPYSYQDFLATIGNIGNRFSKYALNYLYPNKVEKFLNSIQPYISRRLLKDHLDIVPDYVKNIYVPLNDKQRFIYEELTKVVIKKLKEDDDGRLSLQKVKSKFAYISLALHDPSILKNSLEEKEVYSYSLINAIKSWNFENHSKLPILDDLILEIFETKKKLIIWGGHPSSLDQLSIRYKKYNPIVIHGEIKERGKTTDQLKDEAVDKFRNDKDTRILIANYMSLSTQIDLTVCDTQIYFDRGYGLIDYAQSRKRIQGSKQDTPTTTYVIILENSLEEEQDLLLENKSVLNDVAFNRDVLSKEEWKRIFNNSGL